MAGHRKYLGAAVSVTDNGLTLDVEHVRGILSPVHLLRKRRDPFRYDLKNEEFASFVGRIIKAGAPPTTPVLFRTVGLLDKKSEEYARLAAAYPDKVRANPEQPALELVYGNRRLYGTIEALVHWRAVSPEKTIKGRLLAVHRALTDEEAEAEFVAENAHRARTSVLEDQLTVRTMIARNAPWSEIAAELNRPEKEVRREHNPLLSAHMAVVQAYSAGAIKTRQHLLRIVALNKKDQPAALEDDSLVKAKPRDKRVPLSEIPFDELRFILDERAKPKDYPLLREFIARYHS